MTDPRIVTPQDARAVRHEFSHRDDRDALLIQRLAHTVATEDERTRAAVVKALQDAAEASYDYTDHDGVAHALMARADAIENGADW